MVLSLVMRVDRLDMAVVVVHLKDKISILNINLASHE